MLLFSPCEIPLWLLGGYLLFKGQSKLKAEGSARLPARNT